MGTNFSRPQPMGVYGTSTFFQGEPSTPSAHPAPPSSSCTTLSTIGNLAVSTSAPLTSATSAAVSVPSSSSPVPSGSSTPSAGASSSPSGASVTSAPVSASSGLVPSHGISDSSASVSASGSVNIAFFATFFSVSSLLLDCVIA